MRQEKKRRSKINKILSERLKLGNGTRHQSLTTISVLKNTSKSTKRGWPNDKNGSSLTDDIGRLF